MEHKVVYPIVRTPGGMMSKPFTNPFFEADMSKLFDMSKFDMSKFDMSKMTADMRMPSFDMEGIFTQQRRNMEALTALTQTAMESWQSLFRRQADTARQMMEEQAQTAQAIMACPSPEEKVIKQAEASKAAMDKCLANMRDISETISKCNGQAMETVTLRMNEGLDELRGIIKNRAA
jgi:phasin family protein